MEAYFVETPVGIFILDQKGDIAERLFFSTDPTNAASELKDIQDGKISVPILETLKRAAEHYSPIVFESEQLARTARTEGGITVSARGTPLAEQFRNRLATEEKDRDRWLNLQSLAIPSLKSPRSYNDFARRVTLELARFRNR